jgi:hypothetical protein
MRSHTAKCRVERLTEELDGGARGDGVQIGVGDLRVSDPATMRNRAEEKERTVSAGWKAKGRALPLPLLLLLLCVCSLSLT